MEERGTRRKGKGVGLEGGVPGAAGGGSGQGVAQTGCSTHGAAEQRGTYEHPENTFLGKTLVSLSSSATETRAETEQVAPGQARVNACTGADPPLLHSRH